MARAGASCTASTASADSRCSRSQRASSVVGAFSIAAAAARSLGAGARAIWVMFLPVLVAAPWAWSIRAQMLALPLYTGLLWLLATQARRPTQARLARAPAARRLGEHARKRRARSAPRDAARRIRARPEPRRDAGLGASRSSSSPRSPCSRPRTARSRPLRYYHLLLVDPPFAGRVTEWHWAEPAANTMFFYVLARDRGRARMARAKPADGLRRGGARPHVRRGGHARSVGSRGSRSRAWSSFPLPSAADSRASSPGEPRRGLNLAIATGLDRRARRRRRLALRRDDTWFEEYWPREAVEAVRAGSRTRRPRLRLRSLLRLDALQDPGAPWPHGIRRPLRALRRGTSSTASRTTTSRTGHDWKSFADGYRIVIVDEKRRSHTADFLAEPGARAIYRDDELTVIARPPRRRSARGSAQHDDAAAIEDHLPAGSASSRATNACTRSGWFVRIGESGRHDPGIGAIDDDPLRPAEERHGVDVPPRGEMATGAVAMP